MTIITYANAVRDAIREEMRRDERVFVMGEDVVAGPFGNTAHLVDEFGIKRVRNTAIAETTTVDAALGAALTGMRPVLDMHAYAAFLYVAFNAIVTDVARARYMFGRGVPLTILAYGGAYLASGASHSESVQAKLMNAPGLKVVMPATPYDAKGLMKTSIRDDDPVIFLGHMTSLTDRGEVPDEEYTIPLGQAVVRTEGKDVTVVATSTMGKIAIKAAKRLASKGISVEVIDPRTLVPLDKETILESVAKTGRLVAMDESNKTCGVASEIAAIVCEEAFDCIKAPIRRIATMDVPFAGAPNLEAFILPNENKLIEAIEEIMG
jgi:pyruvate/2-oxoglutarate/acetoin dehydrogenase E1 component